MKIIFATKKWISKKWIRNNLWNLPNSWISTRVNHNIPNHNCLVPLPHILTNLIKNKESFLFHKSRRFVNKSNMKMKIIVFLKKMILHIMRSNRSLIFWLNQILLMMKLMKIRSGLLPQKQSRKSCKRKRKPNKNLNREKEKRLLRS